MARRRLGPLRLVFAALLLLVAGAACQVDVGVGVDTQADGSGTVRVTATLDKEAAAQAGPLALDDLRKAGWRVDGPTPTDSGGQVVRVTKPFRNPAEMSAAMAEVSGANGPFKDFGVRRRRSFFTTTTRFQGVVDLTSGVAGFTDEDLRQRLGGTDSALDPAAVERVLRARLNQLFSFTVSSRLPGTVTTSNAPTVAGNGAVWKPKFGDKITLRASSRTYNTAPIVFSGLAALAAVGLLVLLTVRLVRRMAGPREEGSAVADTPPP